MPSDLMPEYDAYEFAISNTNNRKFLRDYKLRQTILSLIYEFFRQRNAVMLYLCETGDNRRNIEAVCLNRGSAHRGITLPLFFVLTIPNLYPSPNNSATRLLCFVTNPNNLSHRNIPNSPATLQASIELRT